MFGLNKKNRKAMIGDSLMETMLWILFFIIAAYAVYFLIKKLTG